MAVNALDEYLQYPLYPPNFDHFEKILLDHNHSEEPSIVSKDDQELFTRGELLYLKYPPNFNHFEKILLDHNHSEEQ